MQAVRTQEDTLFDQDIAQLATQVQSRPPLVVRPTSTRGRAYWMAWLVAPLALGAIGIGLLWQWNPAIGVPPAPARVLAVLEGNPCAVRMVHIMTAIATYRAQRGTAPRTLTDLVPGYLAEPPVDPASGQPYKYKHSGESVVLGCPNAERHAPIAPVPPS